MPPLGRFQPILIYCNDNFRYSDETQKVFGKIVKGLVRKYDGEISIALLSCPSLYQTVQSINRKVLVFNYFRGLKSHFYFLDNVKIFEFDKRFESFGADFQFYDYSSALDENYLIEYAESFDLVIADPPFLSEECLEKTSVLVKRLLKYDGLIILNTGSIQRDFAKKFLDLKESTYQPQHKNNLANEFSSFVNFDLEKYM